jgi:hypothetical protein
MSRRIPLTIGDTTANLDLVVRTRATLATVDLTTATSIDMRFRAEGTTTLITTLTGEKLAGEVLNNGVIDTTSAALGEHGRVRFDLAPVLDEDPGYYEGEIVITYADGLVQTLLDRLNFTLRESL